MSTPITKKFVTFLQMIKIEHSIFALPFAYLGLILAEEGLPTWRLFILITIAMVSFRTMGMAVNRLIDHHIDQRNPRTENRALPAKQLRPGFVWWLTLIFGAIFVGSCAALNPLCLQLAPIPITLAFVYPWAKRFTWLSHLILGIILGIAPYGAWVASRETFSWIPGFLMIGIATWVAGFDIIYALQDEEFDRQEGLYSIPARFGQKASLWITGCLHALTLVAWGLAGITAQLGWIYYVGIAFVAGFLIREHWLIHSFGLKKVQEAFFTMNAVVSVAIFVAVAFDLSFGGMS